MPDGERPWEWPETVLIGCVRMLAMGRARTVLAQNRTPGSRSLARVRPARPPSVRRGGPNARTPLSRVAAPHGCRQADPARRPGLPLHRFGRALEEGVY